MSIQEDRDLSPAAARLALTAPKEWDAFKTAFRKYAETERDNLVKSSLEELPRSQGRAQQNAKLVVLFDDAVNAADRISGRAGPK